MGPLQRKSELEKLRKASKGLRGGTAAKRQARAALAEHERQIIARMTPDELAQPLIKSDKAGWANISRQARSILVERGTGCIVTAPKGDREVAITRRRREPVRYNTTLEIDQYLKKLEGFEDRIPHMYLDTAGNVTVGYGHLIPDAAAARALGFVDRATRTPAAGAHVENAYNKVKNSGLVNARADMFKTLTHIDLRDPEIDALFRDDAQEFLRQLRHIFPEFDSFPQKAKWGTLDLIYNLGIVRFRGLFTMFHRAVMERNWKLAAAQSKRSETDTRTGKLIQGVVDRNRAVRDWLVEAARQEPLFIKSQPRSCQVKWQDLMR